MSYQQPNPWQTPSAADVNPMQDWQRRQDEDHLNLLSIFYYINAGLHILSTLGIAFYFGLGGLLIGQSGGDMSRSDAAVASSVILGIGGLSTLLSIAYTVYIFYVAKWLKTHENSTAIYVAAALTCLSFPLGTALGVFTFIVMGRPSVQALFQPRYYNSNR